MLTSYIVIGLQKLDYTPNIPIKKWDVLIMVSSGLLPVTVGGRARTNFVKAWDKKEWGTSYRNSHL